MEDFRVDVIVGKGPGATAIPLDVEPFTLVGATTRAGLLTGPMRDRFGFVGHLDFYEPAELDILLHRSARILGVAAHRGRRDRDRRPVPGHAPHRQPAAAAGARLRRGPGRRHRQRRDRPGRTAGLRRRRPRAGPAGQGGARPRWCARSAAVRSVCPRSRSRWGSSRTPSRRCVSRFSSGPGLLARTPRGRVATAGAWRHLGLTPPDRLTFGDRLGSGISGRPDTMGYGATPAPDLFSQEP